LVTCAIFWIKYFTIRTGISTKVYSAVKLFISGFEGLGSSWLVLVYYEAATATSRALAGNNVTFRLNLKIDSASKYALLFPDGSTCLKLSYKRVP